MAETQATENQLSIQQQSAVDLLLAGLCDRELTEKRLAGLRGAAHSGLSDVGADSTGRQSSGEATAPAEADAGAG